MRIMTKILAGGAGIAALAAAGPAAAQYYYGQPYGNAYGYNTYGYQAQASQMAAQRCSAAVQSRLSQRGGLTGILGAVLGAQTYGGRVLQVTQVNPRRSTVRVRGLASSGARYGGYGPYGVGAYGAAGYAYAPDLSFRCDVDYRGYVRDVDIDRRR
jgi:hypothetical protein